MLNFKFSQGSQKQAAPQMLNGQMNGAHDMNMDLNNRFVYSNDLFVSNPMQSVES